MPRAARDLQLVYCNFAPAPHDPEHPGDNPFILSAEIEYPEHESIRVTFGGKPEAVLDPDQIAVSDPLDILVPDGERYFVRTHVRATKPPYKWPLTRYACPPAGDWVVVGRDLDNISETTGERNQQFRSFGPSNIFGQTLRPAASVVIIGDSVVCGENGPGDALGDGGYAERGLADHIAWCNLSLPGDSAGAFVKLARRRLALITGRCTHAICALGIADVRSNNEALVRQNLQKLWDMLSGLGLKVHQTTITTHTNSTDRWTTVGGQTFANPAFEPGAIYHRINQWIRSVPPPLSGVFDPAAILETSLDSGIWIAPDHQAITGDGPHLDPLGAALAAKCIEVGKLQTL